MAPPGRIYGLADGRKRRFDRDVGPRQSIARFLSAQNPKSGVGIARMLVDDTAGGIREFRLRAADQALVANFDYILGLQG